MGSTSPKVLRHGDMARLHALSRRLRREAADIAAAEYRWLVALEEFDRDGGYALEGAKSMAGWLSWACGLSGEAARERVRVARALPGLPLVSARFAQGRLSFSKVRAITRVATPDNEETLVTYADHATAAQLEAVVRGFRVVNRDLEERDPDGTEDLAHRERRGVRWWVDDDGYVRISARLPGDDGMLVVKALETVADDLAQQPADADGEAAGDPVFGVGDRPVASKRWQTPEPAEVRRADALRVLADTTLASGAAERTGDERYQVAVVVRENHLAPDEDDRARKEGGDPTVQEHATSTRCAHPADGDAAPLPMPLPGEPWPVPEPAAYIPGGPALPQATVRRISCDASLVTLVEDALGRPLGVGRQTRIVPRRLRRALTRRDRGCRFPGCTTTRHLDAHHVWHWAQGGPTDLENLILVCRFHHTVLHEGNFTIALVAPGRFTFHRPDGTVIETTATSRGGDADRLVTDNLTNGAAPTPDSLIPDWDGTRQDISAAVEVLGEIALRSRRHDAGGVSAETDRPIPNGRWREPAAAGRPSD